MAFVKHKNTSDSEHEKIWNLLPWYVNHSLDPVERDVVEDHIKTCIKCRIEINKQQQLFHEMQHTSVLPQVSQDSFVKLKERLRQRPVSSAAAEHNLPKILQTFFFWQRWDIVKYAVLAVCLFMLVTPLMLNAPIDLPELEGEYRTLADSTEDVQQPNNIVRIVFADQSSPEQIEAVLHDISGHIVNGPSNKDVYDVQIGNNRTTTQEVNHAISQLRANPMVIFVEPGHAMSFSD